MPTMKPYTPPLAGTAWDSVYDPSQASIFDSTLEKVVRTLATVTGINDPTQVAAALVNPTPVKGSLTLYRGVKAPGDAFLRGRQGGSLVSSAMDQVGESGAFFSKDPDIARMYSQDLFEGVNRPGSGIWVTRANKKDAPAHWMSRMWSEQSHIVDIDKQRGKLRFIPQQRAWRSREHGIDAIRRRASKELSGTAAEVRQKWLERRIKNRNAIMDEILDKWGLLQDE